MNSITKKICPQCGKEFRTRVTDKIFCSLSCESDSKDQPESWNKNTNKEIAKMAEMKKMLEGKISESKEALHKQELEMAVLKARLEALYEIYNSMQKL